MNKTSPATVFAEASQAVRTAKRNARTQAATTNLENARAFRGGAMGQYMR